MHPRRLYIEHILPAMAEFKKGYRERHVGLGRDIARGGDLADLLLNLPDYIYGEPDRSNLLIQYKNARDYRERYAWKMEECYEVACDFANAWKHKMVSRHGKTISGMADVQEAYALCRYRDDEGTYYRSHKMIVLRNSEGQEADLRRVLVTAAKFWATELHRLGLTPQTPSSFFDFEERFSRTDEQAQTPLTIHGISGEQISSIHPRSFDFDDATGKWIDVAPDTSFKFEVPVTLIVHPSPFAGESAA